MNAAEPKLPARAYASLTPLDLASPSLRLPASSLELRLTPGVFVRDPVVLMWLGVAGLLLYGNLSGPVLWASLGAIGVVSVVQYFRSRGRSPLEKGLVSAGATITAGDFETAQAQLLELAAATERFPNLRAEAVSRLAFIAARSGRIGEARELYDRTYRYGAKVTAWDDGTLALMEREVATCHVLEGDLASAREWLDAARERFRSQWPAFFVLVEALIRVKSDDAGTVPELIDELWSDARSSLHESELRALRVIQAFAVEQRAEAGYRSDRVAGLLDELEGSEPGEYDYLAHDWPQLREFLERHSLAPRE